MLHIYCKGSICCAWTLVVVVVIVIIIVVTAIVRAIMVVFEINVIVAEVVNSNSSKSNCDNVIIIAIVE